MSRSIARVFFFAAALICALPGWGQLNLKIGYGLGLMNPANTNDIMDRVNQQNPWFDDDFRDLNLISGVTIGFRNRWDFIGLECSWTAKLARRKAEGLRPSDNTTFRQELFFRYNSFSAGAEFFSGPFAVGGTIDGSDYILRTEFSDETETIRLVDDFHVTSTFYISYELITSDVLSLAFRPYVQVPWTNINVYGMEEHFFPNSTTQPEAFQENLLNFGLQLLFYNGVQPR